MGLKHFIALNRSALDICIRRRTGVAPATDEEREQIVIDDVSVYNWVRTEMKRTRMYAFGEKK